MKFNFPFLLTILLVIVAGIYFVFQPELQQKTAPAVVHVGVLPDENAKKLHERFDLLLHYLSEKTGRTFKLVLCADYQELVQKFGEQKVDLAYLGGLTFLQAHALYNAEPLVSRDVDRRFTSYFLIKGNNSAKKITDFKGKKFAFGSRLSTSGHLMPRHFMKTKKQITPEKFFSQVLYSGAHDNTAYLVRDGKADLGVSNSEIINSMLKDGRLKENELQILWETPPYPDYVWAVQNNMPDELKTQFRNAFLELDINDVVQKKILISMGAREFLPSGISDYLPLMEIADSLGLLYPEIK